MLPESNTAFPRMVMVPLRAPMPRARTTPEVLITEPSSSSAVDARMRTVPPSALMMPLWSMRVATVAGSMATLYMPLFSKVRVAASPDARMMLPSRASITPSFCAVAPKSATSPPSEAEILPWLRIEAVDPLRVKRQLPLWKSLSLIAMVEARSPPTLTLEFLPKMMPEGLTRKSLPLAVSEPSIWEGLAVTTRSSATDDDDGCLNVTLPEDPMLKLCQLRMALSVVCVTCMAALARLTDAPPETSCSPVGSSLLQSPARLESMTAAVTAMASVSSLLLRRGFGLLFPIFCVFIRLLIFMLMGRGSAETSCSSQNVYAVSIQNRGVRLVPSWSMPLVPAAGLAARRVASDVLMVHAAKGRKRRPTPMPLRL